MTSRWRTWVAVSSICAMAPALPAAAETGSGDPALAAAEVETAWQQWREGRVAEAGRLAGVLLSRDPTHGSARHLHLLTAYVSGRYREALRDFALLAPEYSERDALADVAIDAHTHLGELAKAAALARAAGRPDAHCAWLETRSQRPFSAGLSETTVVPFADRNFLAELMPAVPIEIDGRSMLGHLDTGGAFVAMSPRMAADLGIAVSPIGTGFANNRTTSVSAGIASRLVIGEAELRNVPIVALDALTGVAQGQEIEDMVILGTNILEPFLVTWDNPGQRLVLSPRGRPEALAEHLALHAGEPAEVEFFLNRDHFLFARGGLGERDLVFFVDTGLVTIDPQGRQPAMTMARSTVLELGLAEEAVEGTFVASPEIRLGPLAQSGLSILVSGERMRWNFYGIEAPALLAHGFLKRYVWTLDFDRGKWHFSEPAEQETPDPPAAAIDGVEDYVGGYEVAPGMVLEVTAAEGALLLRAPGQQRVPLSAESGDAFAIPMAGARVVFHRDGEGEITHLVLHQGGGETRAEKVAHEGEGNG